MYLFLESAAGTAAAGSSASMILMFVVLIAVFYFFMIRPENKRKKEAQQMRDSLKVGDNITTIGGIIGDIVSIKDDSIVIETTTDRVRVEFAKFAVSTNNTAEKEAAKQKAVLPKTIAVRMQKFRSRFSGRTIYNFLKNMI